MSNGTQREALAKLLFKARRGAGLSQDRLAKLMGRKQSQISEWERGIYLPGYPVVAEWILYTKADDDPIWEAWRKAQNVVQGITTATN